MATLSDSDEVWKKEITDAHKRMGDLSLFERRGLLTVLQMAALSWVGRKDNQLSQMQEIIDHHKKLILKDCWCGKLNPIHPVTFIPYSSYLLSGAFDKETQLPIPSLAWCIDFPQVEEWYRLHSKSLDIDYVRENMCEIAIPTPSSAKPDQTPPPGRRVHQIDTILAVITALQHAPLKIPDGGKAKIKSACLTRPALFTEAAFEHAWKRAVSDGLVRMENHEKFTQRE